MAEVKGMLLTEYNEAEAMELFREDGRQEGMREGMREGERKGAVETLLSLVRDGILSVKDAAGRAGLDESEFREKLNENR